MLLLLNAKCEYYRVIFCRRTTARFCTYVIAWDLSHGRENVVSRRILELLIFT